MKKKLTLTLLPSARPRQLDNKIRNLARRNKLIAKSRRGLWYFCDLDNRLMSIGDGLTDDEALEYLEGGEK